MPGEKVSLIPRITNLGASSYVRAKFNYTCDGNMANLSDSSIEGMSTDWVKKGDYWYYKNALTTNATLDIFKFVNIPTTLANEDQGKTLQIGIVAEAIQSKNFVPDFNSNQPWGDATISANSNETYVARVQTADTVTVNYENGANMYIEVPDNFLSGLSELMPGDTISQDITIKSNNAPVSYTFKVKPVAENDNKVNDLLNNLILEVKKGTETVFSGNLNQPEPISLGSFVALETGSYTFTVKMPKELGNEYAMINAPIVWTFGSSEENQITPKPIDYSNNYTIELVSVKEDGKTIITTDETVFGINEDEKETTQGILDIVKTRSQYETGNLHTYTITEKTAPEGYRKYDGTIDLKISFKIDETIQKFVIDSTNTSCTAPGLSEGMYKITDDNQKIIIYVSNQEIKPEPVVEEPDPKPETKGTYSIELVKVEEDGETLLKTSDAIFAINNNNLGTKDGKLTIASEREITGITQIDTYTIAEKTAPVGYSKYDGNITLKVAFKKDEANNKYIIDKEKTTINATGLGGKVYSISDDSTNITIYIPNKKIPVPVPEPVTVEEKSPQTGDIKIKIAIAIFIIAAICLIVIFVVDKKSKDKQKNK